MNLKRIIFFIGAISVSFLTGAQNLSQQNWYFGNSANAIKFNRSTNKASLVSGKFIPFGIGGSAVATDASNADLLFYTDGKNIYDASNVLMDAANVATNGAGLLGNNSANQPAVICPVPEDSTKYLLFANDANYTTGGTITVSVVDMTAFGNAVSPAPALGNVIKKNLATGLTGRSEGMTIIPHSNKKDYWLISHQNGSTTFTASQISKTSFNVGAGTFTFTSAAISSGLGVPMTVANFSYNSKLKKLAVSAQDTNTDAIILNFDDATGAITFDRYIFNTGAPTTTNQSIYDIQWDNSGQYLYISRTGETGINADVLQYDYVNSNPGAPTTILTSVLKTTEFRSWGLQMAPDSAIYHIYQTVSGGPFLVKKFTKTDTIASSVIETALPLGAIDFKGTQFPSFSPEARNILQLSFTPLTVCQNNNTTFFPTVIPTADSLHWDFGDATARVTAWSPIHKYKIAGTINVRLTAYYQGDSTSITQPITVNAFGLKLTLPTDTTACHPEFPTPYGTKTRFTNSFHVPLRDSGATAGVTYTWSDGETGKTLWPLKPGYYYVTSSVDANGCSAHVGVNVKEYELQDQRSNIWYFGNNAGIDFNPLVATPSGPAVPLSGSNMNAPEGCAIVCDRNGQVIFYTDGDQVYDKTKTSIASGLGGDPTSSESALIVPVPGDETLYYIFTTQAVQFGSNNELRYSLFDLKLNNGNGGIAPGQKGILLFSKSTERITASTNWLIAHEWGNNTFRAYRITQAGLGDPVYSAIGSDHSFEISQNAEGYMRLGPSPANTLAVALASSGSNLVELFHLNDSTGVLSNYRKLVLSNTSGQVYGVEFSGGGNKVFATVSGTTSSSIYEYAIDSLGHTTLKRDTTFAVKAGALALGPDGKIYVAIDNSNKLGVITPTDALNSKSAIDMGTGFALAAGTNSRMGLPNFKQQVSTGFSGPGFTWAGICLGTPTTFTGTPTDPTIDKYTWSFGDGGGSSILSPTHLYGAANTYLVIFQIDNRCLVEEGKSSIVTKHSVIINAPPAPPSLTVPSPAICTAPVTLDANTPNTAGLTYLWSTGETTKTISVATPMSVNVTNTDANGCTSTASTNIGDGRPQVNLGPDQTLCQNAPVVALDAKNSGDTYTWSITDLTTLVVTPGGTAQTQGVNVTSPGKFLYSVVVTDPTTGCFANAQTTFTVNQSPTFAMTGTNLTNCTSNDGKISLTAISSSHVYTYSITGPTSIPIAFDQNTATQGPFTGLSAGTYSAIISDQVSGCYTFKTIALNSGTFTVTPSAAPQCDPPSITINTSATGSWTYLITNTSTGATTPTTPPSPSFSSSPQTVQVGSQGQGVTISYNVQVTDNAGCVKSASVSVATTTTTPLKFNFNPCDGTLTETTGATSPNWSVNGTPVSAPVSLVLGTNTYKLDAQSNGCPVTLSSSYKFDGQIDPNFTFNKCSDEVILTANAVGSTYTYRWYESGSVIAIGQPVDIGPAPYHKTVSLEIQDSQSGCKTPQTPKDVEVLGKPTVKLTSDAKCDDGKPFTLSTATTNAPSPTYQWYLNRTVISGAADPTLKQTSNGWYKVEITQGACPAIDSTEVKKSPLPVGKLKQEYQICNDPDNHDPSTFTALLDPGVFVSYSWYKNGVLQPTETSEVYEASEIAKYKVYLTNDFACSNYDSARVVLNCEPIIAGPNAFRPASALTENTYFQLFTFFIDSFEVIVFNRWGEPVFESKDEKFHWNGGYNNNPGQPLPGGTYTYVVRYVSHYNPDAGTQELRGGVVLLR